MTFDELVRAATRTLAQAEIANARGEARSLIMFAADRAENDFILISEDPVAEDVQATFDALIDRRLAREPLSSILGRIGFMGRNFISDARALTPRMDSERLVEAALEVANGTQTGRLVDLGAGSGCLMLSFLHHAPGWVATGLDLSSDALSLARENAEALLLTSRVRWLEGSWDVACAAIAEADIVISNPPYIESEVMRSLEPEVLNYDPELALDGGEDGLDAYRAIIELCGKVMRSGSVILFEIGYDQGNTVPQLLSGHDFASITVLKDYSGHDRVVKATRQ